MADSLFVKREDCTGLALGGNKVRQVIPYIDEAVSNAATVVLASGAVQSNFVRVVAAGCAATGLECEIYLEDRVRGRSGEYYETGNVLLDRLLGARVHLVDDDSDENAISRHLSERADVLRGVGARPFIIDTSIDAPPLGGTGYVPVARELLAQVAERGRELSDVVVATGTGYTQAGLLVGLRMAGSHARVHGIAVRRMADTQRERVSVIARELERMLGLAGHVVDSDIIVDDSQLGPEYGVASEAVIRAVRTAARREGLLLDPVYSGRAGAGLVSLAAGGQFGEGAVVFVHTGGTPALFAYPEVAG